MFHKSNYHQKVTYWAPLPGDTGTGAKLMAAPITLKVRWEDKQEQILDSKGQQTISKAEIYLPPDMPVEIDGFFYNGISTIADPRTVENAFQVLQIMRIPDLRNLTAQNVAII